LAKPVVCCIYNITRVYGVFDNPKDKLGNAKFVNSPLKDILKSGILKEEDLWEAGSSKTLWEAKLYPILLNLLLKVSGLKIYTEYWETSKKLDRGCTNSYIDQIIEICKPYISGAMICGAGGGGFIQMILKDDGEREPLKKALADVFQDNSVNVWDSEIV
jgi:hypothetical protein